MLVSRTIVPKLREIWSGKRGCLVALLFLTITLSAADVAAWKQQIDAAMALAAQGKLPDAETAYEAALQLAEQLPDGQKELAVTLNTFGSFCSNNEQFKKALALLTRAQDVYKSAYGPDHALTRNAQLNLGTAQLRAGQTKEARRIFERLVTEYRAADPDSIDHARALLALGLAEQKSGEHGQAERYFWGALRAHRRHLPPTDPVFENAIRIAASGFVSELNALRVRADDSAMYRKVVLLERLAELYGEFGGAEGEHFVRESVRIREASVNPESPELNRSLVRLGSYLLNHKRHDEARVVFERALAITEKSCEDPASRTEILTNLATVSGSAGDVRAAEELWKAIVVIEETSFGPLHPRATSAMRSAADALRELGGTGAAEEFSRQLEQAQNASQSAPVHTLKDDKDFTPAKPNKRVTPGFPSRARDYAFEPTVMLALDILPDGVPTNIHVIQCAGRDADRQVVKAVQQWRFDPALKGGIPVTFTCTVQVNFKFANQE